MSKDPSELNKRLENLPRRPGVYLLKDVEGQVLYVGKASSLRNRVRSYFRSDASHSTKTRELVRQVADVETIVVGSETEALILEANLIKSHRPRFNIQLRDDKRYPYIKVTVQEPFPRVFVTRRVLRDGARYFGPYTSVGPMRRALDLIKKLYTVRSCRYDLPDEAPERPCLDYHIERCKAPCVGYQSQEDYGEMIDEILRILEGDTAALQAEMEERMREASDRLDFEEAARHRDVLDGLAALSKEQRVHQVGGGDHDVVGLARDGELAAGVVLSVRNGLLLDRSVFRFSDIGSEGDADLLATFTARAFLGRGDRGLEDLPPEVLLPGDFDDRPVLEEALTEAGSRKVRLHVPKRGQKKKLVRLANANARHLLEDRVTALAYASDRADEALYDLQDRLDLKVVPRLIACFDVSHTQGAENVASAVLFQNGEPDKSGYRHMKIKGEWGNDDYRSMAEVVTRYFRRRLEEEEPLPDLVVVDGGKGQLSAAVDALDGLDVHDVQVVALAKKDEEVFLPGRSDPVRLGKRDRALHVLQRIRDEAHRFAISYNRKLRRKRTIRSELSEIPGIGPTRQKALLTRFGSVRGIRSATADEIARVPGFSDVLATRVLTYLGR
ncbi:MAG: excinuclease ABC subunit UvrC [Longimicrobiales bacterium]|nr:excinuclease ABC subunit UvrC [Longimicrobiales bacterium]